MLTYVIMILISILMALIAQNLKRQYEAKKEKSTKALYRIFCLASFLPPFLISAFRAYSIGTDTSGTYYNMYYNVLNGFGGMRDVGYGFINKLAIMLFDDYSGVLILTSLIFCGISFKCIFSESKYPVLSVILFFATNVYFISMNMIRQSIAISLFMMSIPHIKNKSLFKFLILNIIATSIHTTSIIYIALYFLLQRKLKIKTIIIVCILTSLFTSSLGMAVIKLLSGIGYFRKYFAWYLSSRFVTGQLNLFSLLINISILLFLFYIHKSAKEDKDYNILLWLETLATLSLLFSAYIPLMQRVSWMFSFALYIYLPKMFDYIKKPKARIVIKLAVIFCFIAYMTLTIFVNGYNEVVPYVSRFKW
ncbi:MAG: EpsG family protein [Bacilli bacterium]|nr:EpsG family protein [Bacilli bacterium]